MYLCWLTIFILFDYACNYWVLDNSDCQNKRNSPLSWLAYEASYGLLHCYCSKQQHVSYRQPLMNIFVQYIFKSYSMSIHVCWSEKLSEKFYWHLVESSFMFIWGTIFDTENFQPKQISFTSLQTENLHRSIAGLNV